MAGVEGELLGGRELRRVEDAVGPVLVHPAGGADAQRGHAGSLPGARGPRRAGGASASRRPGARGAAAAGGGPARASPAAGPRTPRRKAPALDWRLADLATVELGRGFDVVLAAGNVLLLLTPGTEGAVVANLARHLRPGGLLVAGFQLRMREGQIGLDGYDAL